MYSCLKVPLVNCKQSGVWEATDKKQKNKQKKKQGKNNVKSA